MLPLNTDFIFSQEIVDVLSFLGVSELQKMVPAANPCRDTISVALSGEVLRMPSFWNALIVKFSSNQNIPSISYGLVSAFPGKILWAQPNFLYAPLGTYSSGGGSSAASYTSSPNDSLWLLGRQNRLKHLSNGDAWVDSAWTYTHGDPRIRIGVVDGGMDYRHPDLGGAVGSNARVRGAWNYSFPNAGNKTWLPWSVGSVSHGTSATSIIGAVSDNSIGVAGVCGGDDTLMTGASIYCFSAITSASVSNAVWEASANTGNLSPGSGNGYLWMCDILSFSISTSGKYAIDSSGYGLKDEVVRAAIAFRYQNGRMTFAAMGNGSTVNGTFVTQHAILDSDVTFTGSPQDVDKEWIVAVSITDPYVIENGLDWGMNLDVLAPGTIYACAVDGSSENNPKYSYRGFSSTSCATPTAAGIGGLLLSLHRQLTDPVRVRSNGSYDSIPAVLFPEDVEWLLKHCAVQEVGAPRYSEQTGWGAVKAVQTLEKLNYPYILLHDSIRFTDEDLPAFEEDTMKIVFPGWTRDTTFQPILGRGDSALFKVKRYRLWDSFQIDKGRLGLTNCSIDRVWGRGANSSTGYGKPYKLKKLPFRQPLYRVGYCAVVGDTAFSQDYCELETYVYLARQIRPDGTLSDSVWLPHRPSDTWFTYSILAHVNPQSTAVREPASLAPFTLEVWPNPGNSLFQLACTSRTSGTIDVRILDLLGHEVVPACAIRHDAGVTFYALDLRTLARGTYFLYARSKDQSMIVRKLSVGGR